MNVRRGAATGMLSAALVAGTLTLAPAAHADTTGEAGQRRVTQTAAYTCTGTASQYKRATMADGTTGWTAGFSKTMTAVLNTGSQGAAVAEAQCLLKGYKCDPAGVDGRYGANTKAAVKRYQSKNGLTADGIVGKNTWKKLRQNSYFCG
ncbi:peptidoglycan-binding domain-containing protein [Streptomyces sp. NPDC095613]|uniref:peptidoglycan-binding domain-containing protein n=1 Tax=Streptomyces sp. NPDC095613 TaxID=3155540 RepID=UPI00332047B7